MPEETLFQKKLTEIESHITGFAEKHGRSVESLQRQFDAFVIENARPAGGFGLRSKSIDEVVTEIASADGFDMLKKSGRGRVVLAVKDLLGLETKAAITSSGIVPYGTTAGIGSMGRKLYMLRRIMRSLPIDTGSVFYVRETAFDDAASPQVEADAKQESAFEFEGATSDVKTIAHWTPATKQVLDDSVELGNFIESSLLYGLEREFEEQLLNGDGTGENLDGLMLTATAFDTSLLTATDGWEYVDMLRLAALQLEEAGYGCTAFVVPPRVKARIDLQKNTQGDYINRPPLSQELVEFLWNTVFVPSPAIANNKFLAGDFASGCHLRVRQEGTIDISDSHSDFFTKNKIAIRAEMRAALVKTKPGAFVTGTFSQSPA